MSPVSVRDVPGQYRSRVWPFDRFDRVSGKTEAWHLDSAKIEGLAPFGR